MTILPLTILGAIMFAVINSTYHIGIVKEREPSDTTTTGKSLRDQKALHGDSTSNNNTNVAPSIPGEYVYPDHIIYGQVHMAKTGGTSVNGIFSNKFERVCGN
jgi:hypothetical protein